MTGAVAPGDVDGGPGALLAAWDAGAGAAPLARGAAVALALGALPSVPDPLDLPLGRLARRLVDCLVDASGGCMAGTLTCAGCGALLDLEVDLAAMFPPAAADAQEPSSGGAAGLEVRAPCTRDLLAAAGCATPQAELVRRCVHGQDGTPIAAAELGDEEIEAIDAELERLAGAALPLLRTACPACSATMEALVDPGTLLWSSVQDAAVALMGDVGTLAAAYGWTESEVLALPPRRRAVYLELVTS